MCELLLHIGTYKDTKESFMVDKADKVQIITTKNKPLNVKFNRETARKAAVMAVEKAKNVEKAVDEFHSASERIEEAQSLIATNSDIRRESIATMRISGYSAARISELTGLSPSRIQKILSERSTLSAVR